MHLVCVCYVLVHILSHNLLQHVYLTELVFIKCKVELLIDKLKSHKSPGIDQIPAELIKAGSRTICLEIHKLVTSIWKKEKLPEEWKDSIIIPIHKKGDKTDCNNFRGISLLPTTYNIYPTSCSQG